MRRAEAARSREHTVPVGGEWAGARERVDWGGAEAGSAEAALARLPAATVLAMVGVEAALRGDPQMTFASEAARFEPQRPALDTEACPVCGDRVSGYHYGLLTCESCKVPQHSIS